MLSLQNEFRIKIKLVFNLIVILAGLSACSFFSDDPSSGDNTTRTFGTAWGDQMIESRGNVRIKEALGDLKTAHISITSFNGIVLLLGQVPSEEISILVADTIRKFPKVNKIYNELQVSGPISIFARANDSWLTAKVKTKMAASTLVDANRIKVVTEDGMVYLLGLVTQDEGEAAVDLVRRVYGIQKVIKVFEYIN